MLEMLAVLASTGSGLKNRFSTNVDSMADFMELMRCLLFSNFLNTNNG
jgi:hypothetical protein